MGYGDKFYCCKLCICSCEGEKGVDEFFKIVFDLWLWVMVLYFVEMIVVLVIGVLELFSEGEERVVWCLCC